MMSDKVKTKPFEFNFPLNFNTKETCETFTMSFNNDKVQKNLIIEDFQRALFEKSPSSDDSK